MLSSKTGIQGVIKTCSMLVQAVTAVQTMHCCCQYADCQNRTSDRELLRTAINTWL